MNQQPNRSQQATGPVDAALIERKELSDLRSAVSRLAGENEALRVGHSYLRAALTLDALESKKVAEKLATTETQLLGARLRNQELEVAFAMEKNLLIGAEIHAEMERSSRDGATRDSNVRVLQHILRHPQEIYVPCERTIDGVIEHRNGDRLTPLYELTEHAQGSWSGFEYALTKAAVFIADALVTGVLPFTDVCSSCGGRDLERLEARAIGYTGLLCTRDENPCGDCHEPGGCEACADEVLSDIGDRKYQARKEES